MRISDWSSDVCSSDLPDFEGIKGILQVIGGVVEGYVANTTPKNDPEHRPEYEVVEILGVRSDGVASGEMETVPPDEQDPGDVRQCVPPNYQRAALERSEEHTSETTLTNAQHDVRLHLDKKKT